MSFDQLSGHTIRNSLPLTKLKISLIAQSESAATRKWIHLGYLGVLSGAIYFAGLAFLPLTTIYLPATLRRPGIPLFALLWPKLTGSYHNS